MALGEERGRLFRERMKESVVVAGRWTALGLLIAVNFNRDLIFVVRGHRQRSVDVWRRSPILFVSLQASPAFSLRSALQESILQLRYK